jgi:hypothetical protein
VKDERWAEIFGVPFVECECEQCDRRRAGTATFADFFASTHDFALTFPEGSWQARARSAAIRAMRKHEGIFDFDAWFERWQKRNPKP